MRLTRMKKMKKTQLMKNKFSMKSYLGLFLIAFSLCSCTTNTQNTYNSCPIPENWATFQIQDICTFGVPPTMELRDKNSLMGIFAEAFKDSYYYHLVCNECDLFAGQAQYVFWPSGNNTLDTYARIMVEFDELEEPMPTWDELSYFDKKGLNQYLEEYYRQAFQCIDSMHNTIGVINMNQGEFCWKPSRFETIAGVQCLVLEYIRPGIKSATHVNAYIFSKNTHKITFTLSYNLIDKELFEQDLANFIHYVSFDNGFGRAKE